MGWAAVRSGHDREIVRLALPAFGALIAEPLYLLADTAIVGHLGTRPLGGIAVAAIVLTAVFGIFNFLAYTTTGTVARHIGADNHRAAAEHGIDGVWLAVGLGIGLMVIGIATVPLIVDAMGASASVRPFASEYLRLSLLGAPFVLASLAAAGYLRGLQDTRTTLYVAVGANVVNLLLEVVLVYGLHAGIAGSAWGLRLFRNQVGTYQLKDGRYITSGLCVGSSDLIGYRTVIITNRMVGFRFAQFVAVEVKGPRGTVRQEQRQFLDVVEKAGGLAVLARSLDDVEKAL